MTPEKEAEYRHLESLMSRMGPESRSALAEAGNQLLKEVVARHHATGEPVEVAMSDARLAADGKTLQIWVELASGWRTSVAVENFVGMVELESTPTNDAATNIQ